MAIATFLEHTADTAPEAARPALRAAASAER